MTVAACTPVSWLRLEQFALDELVGTDRAAVSAHLSGCARCRACVDQIAAQSNRELPALPAVTVAPPSRATAATDPDGRRWLSPFRGQGRALAWGAAAGAAAVTMALLVFVPADVPSTGGRRVVAVKGGAVAVELVREREGSIAWEPTSFAAGDRFKLLVTCSPPLEVYADVAVVQGGVPAFPGGPALIRCGNRVPVPGAFSITGPGPATVCLSIDRAAPPARAGFPGGAATRTCVHLGRVE